MPSTSRRALLATLGSVALGGLAGCSLGESEPPAGSLSFANESRLPHSMTMRVEDVGAEPGDEPDAVTGDTTAPPAQRTLTASTTVPPGETQTYESVFTWPAWYVVRFTVDGRSPDDGTGVVAFTPVPEDESGGSTLTGEVGGDGDFTWTVSSTPNLGEFDR